MKCPKCGGKMMWERYQEMTDLFAGWHCLNCGEVIDPEIMINRIFGPVERKKRRGRKRKNG